MADALRTISTRRTEQTERARADQVANNAGGYVFRTGDVTKLRRFLTLGVEGGTFYVDERALTRDNAATVIKVASSPGTEATDLVDAIVEISTGGRAPRENPCLFALAACCKLAATPAQAHYAYLAVDKVVRTGSQLFTFLNYLEQFGGWGHGTMSAVRRWFISRDAGQLGYQLVKYRQRAGWTHRDALRMAHPGRRTLRGRPNREPRSAAHAALYEWVCRRTWSDDLPQIVHLFERCQRATTIDTWLSAIQDAANWKVALSWEMFPDAALNEVRVWESLLYNDMVPQTALIRQLPRFTRLGLCKPFADTTRLIAERIASTERLRRGRVHPINVLLAQRTYAQGHSDKGSTTWEPAAQIVDALDAAFYRAYGAVEPAGKRTMLALDVSASMTWESSRIKNSPLTARDASAAMALVTAATEPDHLITGFCHRLGATLAHGGGIRELAISPRQRLDDVLTYIDGLHAGGTDCSLPMLWALERKIAIETFVIYTDNETWGGSIHPFQALQEYRNKMGIAAKLVVVGLTSTDFSIADPNDVGSMDVAGFDAAVPQLISDFSAGRI